MLVFLLLCKFRQFWSLKSTITDKQVKELGIEITPQHPETELRRAGAIYESITTARDFLANYVVSDGLVVTGQNQNAGAEVAHRLMELIGETR